MLMSSYLTGWIPDKKQMNHPARRDTLNKWQYSRQAGDPASDVTSERQ